MKSEPITNIKIKDFSQTHVSLNHLTPGKSTAASVTAARILDSARKSVCKQRLKKSKLSLKKTSVSTDRFSRLLSLAPRLNEMNEHDERMSDGKGLNKLTDNFHNLLPRTSSIDGFPSSHVGDILKSDKSVLIVEPNQDIFLKDANSVGNDIDANSVGNDIDANSQEFQKNSLQDTGSPQQPNPISDSCPVCGLLIQSGSTVHHAVECCKISSQSNGHSEDDDSQLCEPFPPHQRKVFSEEFHGSSLKGKAAVGGMGENTQPLKGVEGSTMDLDYCLCQLCQKDLSHLNSQRRLQHVNACIDQLQADEKIKEEESRQKEVARIQILECPMCGKRLKTATSRKTHLKKCASSLGVNSEQLLSIVRQQQMEHERKLAAGIFPASFRPQTNIQGNLAKPSGRVAAQPKSKLDEDIQLALALSSSLHPGSPQPIKGAKLTKNKRESFMLDRLSDIQSATRIAERVSSYLAQEENEDEEMLPLPLLNQQNLLKNFTDGLIVMNDTGQSKMFWRLSSLDDKSGSDQPLSFYVPALMPPVEVSTVRLGSKIRKMSEIPGRRHSLDLKDVVLMAEAEQCDVHVVSNTTALVKCSMAECPVRVESNWMSSTDSASYDECPPSTPTATVLAELAAKGELDASICDDQREIEKEVHDAFISMVNCSEFSDVTLKTSDNVTLYAHRIFLLARCPLLLKLAEKDSWCLDMSNWSSDCVLAVLRFLYAGETDIAKELIPSVISLAERLEIATLVDILRKQLKDLTIIPRSCLSETSIKDESITKQLKVFPGEIDEVTKEHVEVHSSCQGTQVTSQTEEDGMKLLPLKASMDSLFTSDSVKDIAATKGGFLNGCVLPQQECSNAPDNLTSEESQQKSILKDRQAEVAQEACMDINSCDVEIVSEDSKDEPVSAVKQCEDGQEKVKLAGFSVHTHSDSTQSFGRIDEPSQDLLSDDDDDDDDLNLIEFLGPHDNNSSSKVGDDGNNKSSTNLQHNELENPSCFSKESLLDHCSSKKEDYQAPAVTDTIDVSDDDLFDEIDCQWLEMGQINSVFTKGKMSNGSKGKENTFKLCGSPLQKSLKRKYSDVWATPDVNKDARSDHNKHRNVLDSTPENENTFKRHGSPLQKSLKQKHSPDIWASPDVIKDARSDHNIVSHASQDTTDMWGVSSLKTSDQQVSLLVPSGKKHSMSTSPDNPTSCSLKQAYQNSATSVTSQDNRRTLSKCNSHESMNDSLHDVLNRIISDTEAVKPNNPSSVESVDSGDVSSHNDSSFQNHTSTIVEQDSLYVAPVLRRATKRSTFLLHTPSPAQSPNAYSQQMSHDSFLGAREFVTSVLKSDKVRSRTGPEHIVCTDLTTDSNLHEKLECKEEEITTQQTLSHVSEITKVQISTDLHVSAQGKTSIPLKKALEHNVEILELATGKTYLSKLNSQFQKITKASMQSSAEEKASEKKDLTDDEYVMILSPDESDLDDVHFKLAGKHEQEDMADSEDSLSSPVKHDSLQYHRQVLCAKTHCFNPVKMLSQENKPSSYNPDVPKTASGMSSLILDFKVVNSSRSQAQELSAVSSDRSLVRNISHSWSVTQSPKAASLSALPGGFITEQDEDDSNELVEAVANLDHDIAVANASFLWSEENDPESGDAINLGSVQISAFETQCQPISQTPVQVGKNQRKHKWVPPSPFTPMPSYEDMTTPQLKTELQKYGIKPVGKKRMRKVLKDIYAKTHVYETDSDCDVTGYLQVSSGSKLQPDTHPSACSKVKPKEKSVKKKKALQDKHDCKTSVRKLKASNVRNVKPSESLPCLAGVLKSPDKKDSKHNKCQEALGKKVRITLPPTVDSTSACSSSPEKGIWSSSQDSDASDKMDMSVFENEEEDSSSQQSCTSGLRQQLSNYILSHPELHEKVLTYEPLDLAVLKEDIKAADIKCSQEKLRSFLDEKCITFTFKNMSFSQKSQRRHKAKKRK